MSKRGNGEGSIYRRDDGRWTASVTLGFESGKRRRKQIYGKTRIEVAKKLSKLQRDVEQGLPVSTPDKLTVGDYLTDWLQNTARPKIRESTYRGYEVQVRLHILPALGAVKLSKLTPSQLQAHYRQQQDSGLGPRSVQMQHKLIKQALAQAVRWNLLPRNVADLVDAPRVPRKTVQHSRSTRLVLSSMLSGATDFMPFTR